MTVAQYTLLISTQKKKECANLQLKEMLLTRNCHHFSACSTPQPRNPNLIPMNWDLTLMNRDLTLADFLLRTDKSCTQLFSGLGLNPQSPPTNDRNCTEKLAPELHLNEKTSPSIPNLHYQEKKCSYDGSKIA